MNKNSLFIPKQEIGNIEEGRSQLVESLINLGILAIAVIALAFSPIFTKLSELEISPTATIFNRLWIATMIMAVWQLFPQPENSTPIQNSKFKYPYQAQGLLILATITATGSSILWAVSFTQTSIASSTVLRSLTPLFISVGAWLILKQRFNIQFIWGMAISVIGGIIIGWGDLQLSQEYLLGDSIALLSAALHGVNILTVGYLRDRGCGVSRVLFWRCGFGALIVFPVVWLTDTSIFPVSLQGWLVIIALAIVCQTFGQGLLVYSLKQFSASFVGIFALLKPIFTAILAWLIFQETISMTSGIASILILWGIYLAKSSSKNN